MRFITGTRRNVMGPLFIPMRDYEISSFDVYVDEEGVIHPHEGL